MMGIVADSVVLLVPPPPKPHVVVTKSRRMVDLKTEGEPPTVPLPDQGNAEPEWILSMLEQLRSDRPRALTAIPLEATDLRFYRVKVENCSTAIHLQAQHP